MKKTHTASCHCGRVRLEADFDLDDGSFKCNCTSCTKTRAWLASVQPADFRLISGEDDLTRYESTRTFQYFCRVCGVRLFGHAKDETADGAFRAVNLGSLDDVDPVRLAGMPVQYFDGRNDDWGSTPSEVRHL
ncbi:MAG TPA: GFA family protein [Gemmatimonadota bacterium]|nr:GFA family protein [Gemmatimonadota bacterium]